MDRKLATIRSIDSIRDIPNADRLEVATFGGWEVVVNRGLYRPNQLVIYCEPDSFVPHELAPYLTKPGSTPRTFRGVQGERLRTIKLRGQISQGLVLPITSIPADTHIEEGMDATALLGIQLYESEAETIAKSGGLAGDQAGLFPTNRVSKSDQERCVSGDTLVATPNGEKEIKDIVSGDVVLSFNHDTGEVQPKTVTGVMVKSRKTSGWFKIRTSSGKVITATGNHRIWVESLQCYRRVDELAVGDTLKKLS